MEFSLVDDQIVFKESLRRATIVNRPNRFIINAVLEDGTLIKCHCPVTGIIGGIKLDGLACLVSEAKVTKGRSTSHTVEAIAVEYDDAPAFQWIGINQNMVNRYIEAFLTAGMLSDIPLLSKVQTVKREPRLGDSRLDFLVNDEIFVEVKTPVKNLQVVYPSHVVQVEPSATGTERMLRQVGDMVAVIKGGKKAIILTVFMYDNPGFQLPKVHNTVYSKTVKAMEAAKKAGLQRAQVNLTFTQDGVSLQKVALSR